MCLLHNHFFFLPRLAHQSKMSPHADDQVMRPEEEEAFTQHESQMRNKHNRTLHKKHMSKVRDERRAIDIEVDAHRTLHRIKNMADNQTKHLSGQDGEDCRNDLMEEKFKKTMSRKKPDKHHNRNDTSRHIQREVADMDDSGSDSGFSDEEGAYARELHYFEQGDHRYHMPGLQQDHGQRHAGDNFVSFSFIIYFHFQISSKLGQSANFCIVRSCFCMQSFFYKAV